MTGDRSWNRKFYTYQVKVFAPTQLAVVTNSVTDPYSLALAADSFEQLAERLRASA